MNAPRILRHGRRARWLHGTNAVVLLTLVVTGLALGDWLPVRWVALAGGHDAINGLHRVLGLAFVLAALVVLAALWRGTVWLAATLARFRRGDVRWVGAYFRALLRPARAPAPWHDGWFDPLERLVLALLLSVTVVVGVSGVYLYFLPSAPLWVFLVAIRAHVYGAWLLLALLAVHILAGLGVLPTHRGLARAMFGDGTVPAATAHRLWPGWAARKQAAPEADAARERRG